MNLRCKISPEELQKLEDFATDILLIHDRHKRMHEETVKDNIDISNKLMALYVSVKSEVRKHTPKQEVE